MSRLLKVIFWKFYILRRKGSCTQESNCGSVNLNDTYNSVQESTVHVFRELTLAAITSEVVEARYFAFLLQSKNIFKIEQIPNVIS